MAFPLAATAARQARALEAQEHRPWPAPGWPWSVAQTLADGVFCHWPVAPEALAPLLPPGVEADVRDGRAWLTIAALRVTGLRLRGLLPVPRLSDGAELVVRAAVVVGDRQATVLLDAACSSRVAAAAARRLYGLPAASSRIRLVREVDAVRVETSRTRPGGAPAVFHARVVATGPPEVAAPGSIEAFLHERFLLVVGRPGGSLMLAEQHRPPWRLAPARAVVTLQTVAPSGLAAGAPALAHSAEQLDQLVWAPERQEA